MCLDGGDESVAQILSICTSILLNQRDVILCCLTVQLPIDVYTTLVFSQRIVITLFCQDVIENRFIITNIGQCCQFAYCRMNQNFLGRNMETQFLFSQR